MGSQFHFYLISLLSIIFSANVVGQWTEKPYIKKMISVWVMIYYFVIRMLITSYEEWETKNSKIMQST